MAKPWAQLVSTADLESDPVMITESSITIGRAPGNDISFVGNKLVSSKHCIIERDADGKSWIQDFSTNGTLLNRRRKINKERVPVSHGDEIFVVYRKDHPEQNISFLFQDMLALQREVPSSPLESHSETDVATSELDTTGPSDVENLGAAKLKEKSQESKRQHSLSELPGVPAAKKHCSGDSRLAAEKDSVVTSGADSGGDKIGEDKKKSIDVKKKEGPEGNNEKEKQEDSQESEDEIEQSLICIICQEIFHQCVSLQPCMHSYCAGCYSDWMSKSNECPSCRAKVVRINKNHLVNNLVEAFLKKHPGKARDEEELKELDNKNKITSDMLYPARTPVSDEESSIEGSDQEDNSPEAFTFTQSRRIVPPTHDIRFAATYTPPIPLAIATYCRQCPGYTGALPVATAPREQPNLSKDAGEDEREDPGEGTSGGSTAERNESLPDVKHNPVAPPFVCMYNQTHLLCNCCFQRMPDRRQESEAHPGRVPPTQCELCFKIYCHAYWGCMKADCLGCLGRLRDINFGKPCLKYVIMDNPIESGVIEKYLNIKNMSVKDVLKICVRRLEGGAYSTFDQQRSNITGDTVVCYACGIRNFKELIYQFRRDIPRDQLPEGVTSRPDCHWGRNCRTQRHNINHATRFNHICEQTALSDR